MPGNDKPQPSARLRRWAALALAAAAGLPATASARGATLPSLRRMVADQLVDDARSRGRDLALPVMLANTQALVLLREAVKTDPNDAQGWRLLSEAAITARQTPLARKALLNLVQLKPGDLRAQVQYLNALAQGKQTVQGQMGIYRAALKSKNLSTQVRSVAALRLAGLLAQAGENVRALTAYRHAAQLDHANVAAWRGVLAELARRAHPPTLRQFTAIRHMVQADPFDFTGLLEGGRLLANAHAPKQAAGWIGAAVADQRRLGLKIPPALILSGITQLALAREENVGAPLLAQMAASKQAPMAALLLKYQLDAPGQITPGRRHDPLLARIRSRLHAAAARRPHNAALLTAEIWFNLFYSPRVSAKTAGRMTTLADLLNANNPVYLRLRGWQLLRAGDYKAAAAEFQQTPHDPYATLGMIRIAEATHKKSAARAMLKKMWAQPLSGLLDLQVAAEARSLHLRLKQTKNGRKLKRMATHVAGILLRAANDPRNVVLVTADMDHSQFNYGQPIILNVHYYNTTDHSLSVGPTGAITTSLAMVGQLRGIEVQNLGVFALDSNAQVYRLGSRNTLTVHYHVDQGALREILHAFPNRFISVGLQIITNPREVKGRMFPGLGGQWISANVFDIRGLIHGGLQLRQFIDGLPDITGRNQAVAAGALINVLPGLSGPGASALRKSLIANLRTLLTQRHNTLEKAWLERVAPLEGLPPQIAKPLNAQQRSPRALLRILTWTRLWALARISKVKTNGIPTRHAMSNILRRAAKGDHNPLARMWAQTLLAEGKLPPPKPPAKMPAPPPPHASHASGK